MIPRGSRLALFGLALLLTLLMFIKGRAPAPKGEGAALFVPGSNKMVTVRLSGSVANPGVYRFPVGTTVTAAIKMTLPGSSLPPTDPALSGRELHPGDIITVSARRGQPAVLSMDSMGAGERMLLGIPLDPDRLSPGEWELLPGIGPVLARRIVDDRHNNGAFGSLQGVLRVPGVGPAKLQGIKRYF